MKLSIIKKYLAIDLTLLTSTVALLWLASTTKVPWLYLLGLAPSLAFAWISRKQFNYSQQLEADAAALRTLRNAMQDLEASQAIEKAQAADPPCLTCAFFMRSDRGSPDICNAFHSPDQVEESCPDWLEKWEIKRGDRP